MANQHKPWMASARRGGVAGIINKKVQAALAAAGALVLTALPVSVAAAPNNVVPPDVNASVLVHPTLGPIVTIGQLRLANGSAASGTVAALAWPTPDNLKAIPVGGSFGAPTVGWTTAQANGVFSLRVNTAQVTSRYRSTSGTVNLELIAWSGGTEGITFAPVSMEQVSTRAAALNAVTTSVTVTMNRPIAQRASPSASGNPSATEGPDISCVDVKEGNPAYPYAIVGTTFPFPYDSNYGWMTVSRTQSQSYSVGVGFSDNGSTWSADGTSSYSTTFGFDWSPDGSTFLHESHDFELTSEYQKFYDNCSGWSDVNEGAAGGDTTTNPGWQGFSYNCQATGPGYWYHTTSGGSSFTLGGGVLIKGSIGINLSLTTAYDSSRTLTYRILDNTDMCGSNNVPAQAAQVSEE